MPWQYTVGPVFLYCDRMIGFFPGNFYAIKNVGHLGNKKGEFYQGGEKLQGKRRIPSPAGTKRRSGHEITANEINT